MLSGYINGLRFGHLLQLFEEERANCAIRFSTEDRSSVLGYCLLRDGQLIRAQAVCEDGSKIVGKDAVRLLISDGRMSCMTIRRVSGVTDEPEPTLRGVTAAQLLVQCESCDGAQVTQQFKDEVSNARCAEDLEQSLTQHNVHPKTAKELAQVLRCWNDTSVGYHETLTDEEKHMLEEALNELKGVGGYRSSAVLDHTGEVLAIDDQSQTNLDELGATFNDIFRQAHQAAEAIGLEALEEMTLKTPNGLVIISCGGVHKDPHVHAIARLDVDGNPALLRLKLKKVFKLIEKELG